MPGPNVSLPALSPPTVITDHAPRAWTEGNTYQTENLTGMARVPLEPSALRRCGGCRNAVTSAANGGSTPSSGRALPAAAPLRPRREPSGIQRWRQRRTVGTGTAGQRGQLGAQLCAQPGRSPRPFPGKPLQNERLPEAGWQPGRHATSDIKHSTVFISLELGWRLHLHFVRL